MSNYATDILLDNLGDIVSGRPNLGEMVSIRMYRTLLYSIRHVLNNEFSKEFADNIIYKSGKLSGEKFCRDNLNKNLQLTEFFTELKKILIEQKIGILRIESIDKEKDEILLAIAEDLDCSGIPFVEETVCNFDEGFIAGIMKEYTGKEFSVKEVDCWGVGGRVCRFLVNNPQ